MVMGDVKGENDGVRLVGGRGDRTTERLMCVMTGLSVCEADDVGINELDQDGDHTGIVELCVVTVVVVVVIVVGVEVVGACGRLELGIGSGCVVFRDGVEDGHDGSEVV